MGLLEDIYSLTEDPLVEEIFFLGSMPNVQQYLAEEALDNSKLIFMLILFVDVILRGISQVFLCNHPITGIFICIGLAFTSFELLGYALLATAIATLSAVAIGKPPRGNVLAGLCGYDGALVGCACYSFLARDYSLKICVLLSSFAGVVHQATANLLHVWELPPFTSAFNIVTILFLFASSQGILTEKMASSSPNPLASNSHYTDYVNFYYIVDTTFRGVGQFMFVDTTVGSAFVVAGIGICSRAGAVVSMTGALIGFIMAYYIFHVQGSNLYAVRNGLYGYNCAGTITALAGGVFYKTSDNAFLIGVYGAMFSALFVVGLQGLFNGLPVLTFPFILSTWLMMLTRTAILTEGGGGFIAPFLRKLKHVVGEDVEEGIATDRVWFRIPGTKSIIRFRGLHLPEIRKADELAELDTRVTHSQSKRIYKDSSQLPAPVEQFTTLGPVVPPSNQSVYAMDRSNNGRRGLNFDSPNSTDSSPRLPVMDELNVSRYAADRSRHGVRNRKGLAELSTHGQRRIRSAAPPAGGGLDGASPGDVEAGAATSGAQQRALKALEE